MLEQIQVQKLTLTPELLQAIKILQCNNTELTELIGEELLSNPMLELSDNQPLSVSIEENANSFDWHQHAIDQKSSMHLFKNNYSESNDFDYEDIAKAEWSLSDFLSMQLSMLKLKPDIEIIAEYIIGTINDLGYRTERASEIASKFGISHDTVMEAIKVVQSLEPPGVAAKNIPECLKLQLERLGEYSEDYETILFEHLDDLAANKINVIAKAINKSVDIASDYCNRIKQLNPKPAVKYSKGQNNKYIVPDIILKEIDGKYYVIQNQNALPLICCSPYYENLLHESEGDKDTLDYLHKKMNQALMLIKGIDQRQRTIQKVTEAIVERQKDFFTEGVMALKPMTLSDIAEEIGIHESTVSRAINGKYLQTSRGLFELKYFFKSSISSIVGDNLSSEAVKKQIKDIIDLENPSKPFSDEKIRSLLFSNYGTDVSRRTIAKYREQMGIAGSSRRKKY